MHLRTGMSFATSFELYSECIAIKVASQIYFKVFNSEKQYYIENQVPEMKMDRVSPDFVKG